MSLVSDQEARQIALDPTRSFIVQAPAGSGKTSLLTQRYLTLLSGVNRPEEILAITFTKKAAGEMRDRIIGALQQARQTECPDDPYLASTWRLARKALDKNDLMGWCLEENPARLRVLTIDSLCAQLASGLPILSQFGAPPSPTEDAAEQYAEAARLTLESVHHQGSEHAQAVSQLLLHLDNDMLRVQEQIARMLAGRDKWMRPLMRLSSDLNELGPKALREALENTLTEAISYHLKLTSERLGPENLLHCARLSHFASQHLPDEHPLAIWRERQSMPSTAVEELPYWQAFGYLLLKGKGNGKWRKQANIKVGFPREQEAKDPVERSTYKAAKQSFKGLLAELNDDEDLRLLVKELATLPPASYTDAQWETLQALLHVSRIAAAQLTLVFRDSNKADFVEVSHRADRALGSEEEPTDLALAMDSKLQHLLVDEFQDTSMGQIQLLKKLTAEWIPGEGRTLFLVGDPMQSIYRFRDADVGLFLKVRQYGLGHRHPESLTLRSNFRSQGKLVDWFNESFSQVFPKLDNPSVGSVSYSQAHPAREPDQLDAVKYWAVLEDHFQDREFNLRAEAEVILNILTQTWEDDPSRSVAILARSRTHLEVLLPLLKERGHRFQGVDLEPLKTRPAVRDLLSLTKALTDFSDRLSWFSILRAPWCGLVTSDLLAIAGAARGKTIAATLRRWSDLEELSQDGKNRLDRVWPVLGEAVENRRRQSLRDTVESVWLALGGPASVVNSTALSDCNTFLNLLEQVSDSISDPMELLQEKMERLYAQPDMTADGRLQIMTIHKSKGLEFDTVIVPALGNPPRSPDEPLVSWQEWSGPQGLSHLLLAPITERGQSRDPVYQFVHTLEKKKEENELARLLYVAVTRAKRQLHLVTRVREDMKSDYGALKDPTKGSFLSLLWQPLSHNFGKSAFADKPILHEPEPTLETEPNGERPPLRLRRLTAEWEWPEIPPDLKAEKPDILNEDEFTENPTFEWAGETVRQVGSAIHRVLQQVGREGLNNWDLNRVKGLQTYLSSKLAAQGVPQDQLEDAVGKALDAVEETLSSKKGRWILDPTHEQARSEYAISGLWAGRLVRTVVDRTFIDEKGNRWIIDYKTGTHMGGNEDKYLDREVERYKPQLKRYAKLLKRLDNRPVKMGLYFPLLKAWKEWSLEEMEQPKQLEFQF